MRISKALDERKEEFITVAEKMFLEYGISDTSVSRIVKEMGVAQGLFYYYFKSKDEVIEAVIDKNITGFEQQLKELAAQETVDFSRQFEEFIGIYYIAYEELRRKFQGKNSKHILELFNHRFRKKVGSVTSEILLQIIQRGIHQGKVRLKHPKRTIQIVVGGVGDLVLDYGFHDRMVLEEILRHTLGIVEPQCRESLD
ncbi:TetR/AcrR family transcriptional regulator [Oscillospiraceae bacterium MB08-C2-2]|nr:TetR/AcrR family transcriptional regulator [Oscillospiraceae bacterium MB08-C2-2]